MRYIVTFTSTCGDRTARTVAIKLGLGIAVSGVFLKAVVYHLPPKSQTWFNHRNEVPLIRHIRRREYTVHK